MKTPRTSVIIPNWNGSKFLSPCLEALKRQSDQDFEVIVVDSHSTDDSLQTLEKDFPEVRVVQLDKNYGFAPAINRGVEQARGEYLVFLNNDTEAEPNWLQELARAMKDNPKVGVADSKIILFSDRSKLDSVGIEYSRWGFSTPRGRGQEESQFTQDTEVFACCGGSSILRRELIEQIGAYDESFFAYLEDVDLSYRIRLAGYICETIPTSRIYHHLGQTSGGLTPFTRYHSIKNLWLVYLKNSPREVLWRTLPRFLLLQGLLLLSALRHGQILPPFKAYGYLLAHLGAVLRARRNIQRGMTADWRGVYKAMGRELPPHLNPLRRSP